MRLSRRECSLLIALVRVIYPEVVTKKFVESIRDLPNWQWKLVIQFQNEVLTYNAKEIPRSSDLKFTAHELLLQLSKMESSQVDMFILQSLQYPVAYEFYVGMTGNRVNHSISNARLESSEEQKKVSLLSVGSLAAFLKMGLDPTIIADDGCNLVVRYFYSQSVEKLKLVLSYVKDSSKLNIPYKSTIPMIFFFILRDEIICFSEQQLTCIKLLLDHGANINATLDNRLTLFEYALTHHALNLIELLVSYDNIDVSRVFRGSNEPNGINPALLLMDVEFEGSLLSKIAVIERLFALGCDVNETFSEVETSLVSKSQSTEMQFLPAQPKANFFTPVAYKILQGVELRHEDRQFTKMLQRAGFDFDSHFVADDIDNYSVGNILQNSDEPEFRAIYARYRRTKEREAALKAFVTIEKVQKSPAFFQKPPVEFSSSIMKDARKIKSQIIDTIQSTIVRVTDQISQHGFSGNIPKWIQDLQNKDVETQLERSIEELQVLEKEVSAWSEQIYRRIQRCANNQESSDALDFEGSSDCQSAVELNAVYEGVLPLQAARLIKIRHTMNAYLMLPRNEDDEIDYSRIDGFSALNDTTQQAFRNELTAPKITKQGSGIRRLKGEPLKCDVYVGDTSDVRHIDFELKITETTDRIGLIRLHAIGTGPTVYALGPVIHKGLHDNRYNHTKFQCSLDLGASAPTNKLGVSL